MGEGNREGGTGRKKRRVRVRRAPRPGRNRGLSGGTGPSGRPVSGSVRVRVGTEGRRTPGSSQTLLVSGVCRHDPGP